MANNKKKGNRGELKIAKALSEHFSKPFKRVPSSGALGTIHIDLQREAMKTLSGDLIVPHDWVFSMEIKTGYDIDFLNIFSKKSTNDKTKLLEFCEQACEDASRVEGRCPMVIYSKDRRETICLIPLKNHSRSKELFSNVKKKKINYMYFQLDMEKHKKWKEWIAVSFEDLLINFNEEFFFDVDLK